MTKFISLGLVALSLGGCVTTGDNNAANRSLQSGGYEADVRGVAKPALFGIFYTYVSHEAWPSGYVQYFPGTSQDTRYPGQCGPVPFNPNKGDYFDRKGNVRPC